MDLFLGRDIEYWRELQLTFEDSGRAGFTRENLLYENAKLRIKVTFYEEMIKRCNEQIGMFE